MSVKTFTMELLRAGPPHNQLLSPLTPYLAIFEERPAKLVNVPYTQREFSRLLKDLRYQSDALDDADRRKEALDTTGTQLGTILQAVPGLATILGSTPPDTLCHLRILLSASELALLPWELSKDPEGTYLTTNNWLSLQTRVPTVITRRVRSVRSDATSWDRPPRILFAYSNAGGEVPYQAHEAVLKQALTPWLYRYDESAGENQELQSNKRKGLEHFLDILCDASYSRIRSMCESNDYTYVHILAHGDEDNQSDYETFGLALSGPQGGPEIVTGDRLATALCVSTENRQWSPTAVTITGCDSGNVGSVIGTGASLAHTLHEAGIPFVIASQFPITIEGSTLVVKSFYQDLLWAKHPLWALHDIRARLFGRQSDQDHDWASLVLYEALPEDFDHQLEAFRYRQAKAALDAAFDEIGVNIQNNETVAPETLCRINRACEALPKVGAYRAESLGLCAASAKRLGEANFFAVTKITLDTNKRQALRLLQPCVQKIRDARAAYREAAESFMVNFGQPTQQVASLHWVGVQVLSLDVVLGRDIDDSLWATSELSAKMYLDHLETSRDDRAWAHGSLAELYLLRAATRNSIDDQQLAMSHVERLVGLCPGVGDFPNLSTRRQFQRYVDWLTHQLLVEAIQYSGIGTGLELHCRQRLGEWARELAHMLSHEGVPLDEGPQAGGSEGEDQ